MTDIIVVGHVADLDTRLARDEAHMLGLIDRCQQEVIAPALAARGGRIVDWPSDALVTAFADAEPALGFALDVQRALAQRAAGRPPDAALRLRLGLDTAEPGAAWPEAVARTEQLAAGGEAGGIRLSQRIEPRTRAALPPLLRETVTLPGGAIETIFVLPARRLADPTGWPGTSPGAEAPETAAGEVIVPGVRLNDTFEIDSLIASGGMGEIYRGHGIQIGDPVAIKLIRLDFARNEAALALFQKEALVLRQIHHEAIVRYYVFAYDPGVRRHYLAMDYVEGIPLSEILRSRALPFDAVLQLARRVGGGLDVAHRAGIVHRDVSPDNILVPEGDVSRAKIIDFGIAKTMAIGSGTLIGGGFAGKYNYVSPEQLGLSGGEVTPRSDIYSFGLVLAEALRGRPIDMGGSQAEIIDKRRSVPDLADIDPRIRPLIQSMLQPEPARRPASMAEVAAWQPAAAAAGPAPRPQGTARRPLLLAGTALVLVAALGIGTGLWLMRPAETPPPVLSTLPDSGLTPGPTPQPSPTPQPGPTPQPSPQPEPGPTPPPVVAPTPPAEALRSFILGFDAGPCFYAWPVEVSAGAAGIEAFALSAEPMKALAAAVQARAGFEPDISGNVVYKRQCPALDFLRATGTGGPARPELFLRSSQLAAGQPLAGSVGAGGDPPVLLQVQEDGTVRNLTEKLTGGGDQKTFSVPLRSATGGGARPQLIVAIAGLPVPSPALAGDGKAAADLFPDLLRVAKDTGRSLSATVKLVTVKE